MSNVCEELEKVIQLVAKNSRLFNADIVLGHLVNPWPYVKTEDIKNGITAFSEFADSETIDKLTKVSDLIPKLRETVLKISMKIKENSRTAYLFYMQSILGLEHNEEDNYLTFQTEDESLVQFYFRGFSWVRKGSNSYYGCIDVSKKIGCNETVKFKWKDGKLTLDLTEDIY